MEYFSSRFVFVATQVVALALAIESSSAAAHGGAYKGPSSPAADAGGGGSGSGGGSASSGGSVPISGATGVQQPGATSATHRGTARPGGTSGKEIQSPVSYDGWEFWWENNRDRYLNLKKRVGRAGVQAGSLSRLTARGTHSTMLSKRPDQDQIDRVIIPTLDSVSKTTDDRDILDSSVLAMGRSASPLSHAMSYENAVELLAHRELSVQASAALTLGVLRAEQAWPLLRGIVNDDSTGRAAVGGSGVPWLVRSFACLALGLIGDARSVRTIMATIDTLPDSERNVKASAIAALGLLPRGSPLAVTAEAYLVMLLEESGLDPHVRSYIPTSLGKLGGTASLSPLLDCFSDDATPNIVRQSAAIGLGQLASVDDGAILDTLADYVREGRDQQTRHFALIALGQIGARDPNPVHHPEIHNRLRTLFLAEMTSKASSRSNRSWSAIAAALYGRGLSSKTAEIVEGLRVGFRKERDPSFRGAFAIALALLNDQSSRALIHEQFTSSNQEDFRGYAGEALGLLRHREASEELLALCGDKSISSTFRLKTATSLGLLGDRQAVPMLIQMLDQVSSLGGLASAAKALGLIGDQTSVGPLIAMAADDNARAASRAFACVALGLLGEKTQLPFNERLKAHNNYLARMPAIAEILRIL